MDDERLIRRLARLEHELAMVREELETRHPKPKPKQRFVQVSFFSGSHLSTDRWDFIDGIGDLKVGDRVAAPLRNFHVVHHAIVARIGRSQDYQGPWSTITRRLHDDEY